MIRAVALASGSNGNSVHVETPDVRLLLDAGLSGKRLAERAATVGEDLSRVGALLLSHNHGDHVSGAGVLHRRYGIPLFATRGTWSASRSRLGGVRGPNLFLAGESLRFGRTRVHTVPTPHDGVDGVAFVVEHGDARLGVLTDLGHPFAALTDLLGTLDAAFLEANYDEEMLWSGPYPERLKARIAGDGGHLSNREAVALAGPAASGRLRLLVLAHLSGANNDPVTAQAAARGLEAGGLEVRVATREAASAILEIPS